jgi:hypothetical protein
MRQNRSNATTPARDETVSNPVAWLLATVAVAHSGVNLHACVEPM